MKKNISKLLILIILLTLLPVKKSYAKAINSQYLNIRLTKPIKQKNVVNFGSNNGFLLFSINNKDDILLDIEDTNIKAVLSENGINLVNSRDDIIFTLPKDGSILISSNTFNSSIITVEKDRYRDYIRLLSRNNEIYVINYVGLENYLYGVVPAEMPATFHMEALKAQAVASRSFAISNINKHSSEGFNLCDTTHCQVYSGVEYERPSTNLAVDETRDVFAYYNGKVIEAIFHSTSSGFTEDSVNVWGGDFPYLKSVEDNFSTESPYSKWSFSISLNELNNNLISSGIDIGNLQGMEIIDSTSTGKVNKVKVIGTKGEKIINGTQFRNIVGAAKFKSSWFDIKSGNMSTSNNQVYIMDGAMLKPQTMDINKAYIIDGKNQNKVTRGTVSRAIGKDKVESLGQFYPINSSEILIEGKGFGHGVGMSQFGAKKMAELGYDFEEILKYYYTGIDVLTNN
ncbi:SpoIID/LytB domain-containing protein [Tissierella sp.]|uniref:SpoIID/LytB domain-containing protein n=1 Tax=Tissierella sp. TaxID=41274 RepID=UPI0028B0223C|nr:SpoIID/LytB domain-containing protein [Tissierella sp.]